MSVPSPEEIKELRKALGLSQVALAEKLGVSFSTVNRWERGHRIPTKLALMRLDALVQGQGLLTDTPNITETISSLDRYQFGLVLRDQILILEELSEHRDTPSTLIIKIKPDLGPLRCMQQTTVRGQGVLLIGARDGVWLTLWPNDDRSQTVKYSMSKNGKKLGINSTLILGKSLYATHSEIGVLRWNLETPTKCELLHQKETSSAKTIRGLTRLDNDRFLFVVDEKLYVSIHGEGIPELLFQDPEGGRITSLVLNEHTLYLGTVKGSLYAFDLIFKRTQPLLSHEKAPVHNLSLIKQNEESYLVIGSKKHHVSLLHLDGSYDRLLFNAGKSILKYATASPSQIIALNQKQESILLWNIEVPGNPICELDLYEEYGQHIQCISLLRLPGGEK